MKSKNNPGSFSINDNKLRITNLNGETSVLFEDISSISFKKSFSRNLMYLIIGIVTYLIGVTLGNSYKGDNYRPNIIGLDISEVSILICVTGLILIILYFIKKLKYDDVIVETRGGMLLTYSVKEGEGKNQVNLIEEQKRLMTNKI
jgi:hypothetical protein